MTTNTTAFYFECHITLAPVPDERLEELKGLVESFGFRMAELLKRNGQSFKDDTFLSSRDENYTNLKTRMLNLIKICKTAGFEVWRYKIEDILLDSKVSDDLMLLN